MAQGVFITLEGGEGAGKTTLLRALAALVRARTGRETVETREPGGAPGAEEIRALLVRGAADRWDARTELFLVAAARADHVARVIAPALARGAVVLCDRFSDSTLAYQGYAGGLGRAAVEAVNTIATGGLCPDLTLVLDLPAQAGLARAGGRAGGNEAQGEARFEAKGAAFHQALRAAFLDIAAREPGRVKVLDARAAPEELCAAAWAHAAAHLGLAP